jgi:hypothetical protein
MEQIRHNMKNGVLFSVTLNIHAAHVFASVEYPTEDNNNAAK